MKHKYEKSSVSLIINLNALERLDKGEELKKTLIIWTKLM